MGRRRHLVQGLDLDRILESGEEVPVVLSVTVVLGVRRQQCRVCSEATDLLGDVIRPNFYAPGGYGLKRLAGHAGAEWRVAGVTGADTYPWIEAARTGDQSAWEQLVEYNEDDVRATHALRMALRQVSDGLRPPATP